MTTVQNGDHVHVHYTGRLEDGSEFDSSRDGDPLCFTVGASQVIPGFENAMVGMTVGETKTVTIPCDQAYGPHEEALLLQVPRTHFPLEITPEVGQYLELTDATSHETAVAVVTQIGDDTVTLDANHPLAGEDLTFDLELVKVGPAPEPKDDDNCGCGCGHTH
ncbi:peptidylprolyl isomerase [Myxococcota bacterium]|jgi:peptidylprolyl isomerase|nr:peptidylprolyl isomerase [Myxococcota bacterium]MBU1413268.1 peptidylprolyl isomerase [Myxococcota bacterium]MBU1510005.1 peptidylprolyl isomerase [Myxococcota bacterium]PKN25363.1 MAG: peptidylprolyl isomerase [Deltaproteobacteria bacterium HGW-Deltaproteobacteria-22]